MTNAATILDMCCGSRMFWFDKQDERAVFTDIRAEQHTLCDGRHLIISPDMIADFRALPFADTSFSVVGSIRHILSTLVQKVGREKNMESLTRILGVMICGMGFPKHFAFCGYTVC